MKRFSANIPCLSFLSTKVTKAAFLYVLVAFTSLAQVHGVTVGKTAGYDHSSINTALNDPMFAGEDVILGPGTYEEDNIVLNNRSLIAESPNNPEQFVISGPDASNGNDIIRSIANARIEGITIRNGRSGIHTAQPSSGPNEIVLKDLIIEGNTDTPESSNGGGIRGPYGNLTITNSIIRSNMGTIGAGISYFANGGTLTIKDSLIEGNVSSGSSEGGGISLDPLSSMTIDDTTIQNNTAYRGAGLAIWGSAILTNVQILNNSATDDGGGVYKGAIDEDTALLTINGGRIEDNQGDRGGGIYLRGTQPSLNSSATITNNIALRGDAGSGGGIRCSDSNMVAISDNSVTSNTPDDVTCQTTEFEVPVDKVPTGGGTAQFRFSAEASDPINTFTGELFTESMIDLELGGPMSLNFERYYASYLRKDFVLGDLGSNWRHNFDFRVFRSGNTLLYVTDKGRVTQFIQNLNTLDWEQQNNLDTPYQVSADVNEDAIVYDPADRMIYTFDATIGGAVVGKLKKAQDEKGNTHEITYDAGSGQIKSISDGIGRSLNFTYNEDSIAKISVVDDGTRSISFEYTDTEDSELLTLYTDARGKTTEYHYEDTTQVADHGLMTHMTRPESNVPYVQTFYDTNTPDASGRVATQTDGLGNTFTFDYDGLETTITDPDNETRIHTHTATGEFGRREDQAGNTFSMGSDGTGRRNSLTDREGDTTSLAYDETSGHLSEFVNAEDSTTGFVYSSRSASGLNIRELTGMQWPDGTSTTFERDPNGNVTKTIDQADNETITTYNEFGQALTRKNAIGGVITLTYNADGTLKTRTDPLGNVTTYGYDALRRVNLITYADDSTESFTYDQNDNPLTLTDGNGNTLTMVYDDNGNLATITDSLDAVDAFGYDALDRHSSWKNPVDGTSSQTFDAYGRILTITDPNGNTTTMGRNSRGQIETLTRADTSSVDFEYSSEKVLSSITDSLDNKTTYTSDKIGRMTHQSSPLGHTTQWTYDEMSRVTSEVDPLDRMTTFSYDELGLISAILLPDDTTIASYQRNGFGNIVQVTDPNGNIWATDYNLAGRQTSFTDPLDNVQTTAYDSLNRQSMITFPDSLGTLEIEYDPNSNIIKKTYSDGTVLNFNYDSNDRLTSADDLVFDYDSAGRLTNSNGIAHTSDPGGRLTTSTLAVGKTVTYTYDSMNRLTQVSDWTGEGAIVFAYDTEGRLTKITRPSGVYTEKMWDADGRLVGIAEEGISDIELTRDAAGQIIAARRDVPLKASAANLDSLALSYDDASQIDAFKYDAMGRVSSDGQSDYTFDLASRLKSIQGPEQTASFNHDSLGYKTSRTQEGETRTFVWDHALSRPSIAVERVASADHRYYIYTPSGDLLYAIDATGSSRHFYHFDEMGNTLFTTSESGVVENMYSYTPYGRIIDQTGEQENPFTWQGKIGACDEGNNLYSLRARFYNAGTGSFLSRDPVKSSNPKEISPYQYALGNPMRYVDPSGREGDEVDDTQKRYRFGDELEIFLRAMHADWEGAASQNDDTIESKANSSYGVFYQEGSSALDLEKRSSGPKVAELAAKKALDAAMAAGKEAVLLHIDELLEAAKKEWAYNTYPTEDFTPERFEKAKQAKDRAKALLRFRDSPPVERTAAPPEEPKVLDRNGNRVIESVIPELQPIIVNL